MHRIGNQQLVTSSFCEFGILKLPKDRSHAAKISPRTLSNKNNANLYAGLVVSCRNVLHEGVGN